MEPWMTQLLTSAVTVIAALVASSGFWAYLQRKSESKNRDVKDEVDEAMKDIKKLLVGLGHDRIVALGMTYIERGYITQEEYENIHDYLWEPYKANGGNGSAEKVMDEVKALPMHASHTYKEV